MTESTHRFCSCWGPEPVLHEGHCCFVVKDGATVIGRDERCPGATETDWQNAISTARRDFDTRLASTRAEVANGHLPLAVAQRRYPTVSDWETPRHIPSPECWCEPCAAPGRWQHRGPLPHTFEPSPGDFEPGDRDDITPTGQPTAIHQ